MMADKQLVAAHEAGHAVVGLVRRVRLHEVELSPKAGQNAHCCWLGIGNRPRERAIVYVAGPCAEAMSRREPPEKVFVSTTVRPREWDDDYQGTLSAAAILLGLPVEEITPHALDAFMETIATEASTIIVARDVLYRALAKKFTDEDRMSCEEIRAFVRIHAPDIDFPEDCVQQRKR
jgi:hypothetical protein